ALDPMWGSMYNISNAPAGYDPTNPANAENASSPWRLQMAAVIPTYVCPADPGGSTPLTYEVYYLGYAPSQPPPSQGAGPTDYAGVPGPRFYPGNTSNFYSPPPENGGIISVAGMGLSGQQPTPPPVNMTSILDGTSNTAMIAERPPLGFSNTAHGRDYSI